MGGALGVIETLVPGLVFVIVLAAGKNAWWAIGVSATVSVGFTAYRVIRRQAPTQALVGLLGVVVSAALAVFSNKPEDNFVPGMLTNAAYGAVLLVSVLVRWPLIGVVVNLLRGQGSHWRKNRHQLRVYTGVTLMWVAMFAVRLLVEYPLYLAGNVAALAVVKIALGLPLYVPVLAATWLIVRSLYRDGIDTTSENLS
jgi:hypothetical protein